MKKQFPEKVDYQTSYNSKFNDFDFNMERGAFRSSHEYRIHGLEDFNLLNSIQKPKGEYLLTSLFPKSL